MNLTTTLTNARLMLAGEVVVGTIRIENGRIADVATGATGITGAENLDGDYLMPGLIELHTDNLEKHVQPRPKVHWPTSSALLAHDAQVVAAQLVSRDPTEPYPGEGAMATQAREVCDVGDLVNREYAAGFADLFVEPSYPITETQWEQGQRVVWCFLRSGSGEVFDASFLD